MSDHPSKDCERQVTEFPEHLVDETLLMLQHSWLWGIEVFQYKCNTNGEGRIGFGFAFKNNKEKNRDSDNQNGPKKKDEALQYPNTSLLKYLQVNMATCLFLKQNTSNNISCMWLLLLFRQQWSSFMLFAILLLAEGNFSHAWYLSPETFCVHFRNCRHVASNYKFP